MGAGESTNPEGWSPGGIPPQVTESLQTLLGLATPEGSGRIPIVDLRVFSRRLADLTVELLGLLISLQRGMEEFRNAYGLAAPSPSAEKAAPADPRDLAAAILNAGETEDPLQRLRQWIRELRIHTAGLLEAHYVSTSEGSRRLLGEMDPAAMAGEFKGSTVKVGPMRVPCVWGPLLMQSVWEEYLKRFQSMKALDPGDFERIFFRDGFTEGYARFLEKHDRSGDHETRGTEETKG
jgi:hypothetical protein